MKTLATCRWALLSMLLTSCGGSPNTTSSGSPQDNPEPPPEPIPSSTCRNAEYPSIEWAQCEQQNYQKTTEAPIENSSDPDFMSRWTEQSVANILEYNDRNRSDPNWNSRANVCASWGQNCLGDPHRYPGTDDWYDTVGVFTPVNFYDNEGARLNGRVWAPKNPPAGKTYPAIVIINGSVQAPEPLYWWVAQLLVQNGYLVMTFDPRGQGRSDSQTPDGQQGSNANSVVFRRNLIDAIDFFYSTPDDVYPHNLPGTPGPDGDGNTAETTAFNPIHELLDRERLGIAGHSLGATGVSVVQGETDWQGVMHDSNPVDVMVAWDNLALAASLDGINVVPRVPSMGQSGDYFLTPTPYTAPPTENKNGGFDLWRDTGIDSFQVNIQGGTHYEWSMLHQFPTTSWEAGKIIAADGSDNGTGWGNPIAQYYTLAWFDRYLKLPGEQGYDDADARLLNDSIFAERFSWYFPSKRAFKTRDGTMQSCEDIARGC